VRTIVAQARNARKRKTRELERGAKKVVNLIRCRDNNDDWQEEEELQYIYT